MIKFGMTVAEMIAQLTRGFTKQTGRIPSGLEKIKIQQEAIQRAKDMNKVLDMKGNPIDPAKPIIGGEQSKNLSGEITSVPSQPGQSGLSYETKNKEAIQRLKDKMKKDPPEELAYGGVAGLLGERTNYRYGGDTMGGKNDKSKTSKGPDRSAVGPGSTYANNVSNQNDRPDYSGVKQIVKQLATNTVKNVGTQKAVSALGLAKYATPIGQILMAKQFIDKVRNPNLDEEEETSGIAGATYADGGRAGFAGGGMGRRGFLKLLAGAGAGITALKSGFLGMGKKAAPIKKVAETATGSGTPPAYFFKLVEKIKMLGDDTPSLATLDRQKVTKYKDYSLTEDVSTGELWIQKNHPDYIDDVTPYQLNQETYMNYKPGENIIGKNNKPIKTADEYVEDTTYTKQDGEIYQVDDGVPEDVVEEVMEEALKPGFNQGGRAGYAAGKGVTSLLNLIKKKFGKDSITTADKIPTPRATLDRDMFKKFDDRNPDQNRLLTDEEIEDYEMELGDSETWMMDGTVGEAEKALIDQKEYMADIMRMKERGDFGDFSPSKLDNVNDAQIEAAVEDVIPTGDNKLDAEMAAESLVENNPQIFGENVLYDDLDDLTKSKIYGAVYDRLSNNMARMIKDKRNLSSPTKTLESIKSGGGIDMSDPNIADEFTRFMKENDPKGFTDMEQKIQLESFDPKTKGRKGNAYGGRIGLLAGGGVLKKLIQNLSKEKGMSGSEVLKVMNWKSLPSEVKNLMTKEEFGRMKAQRLEGVEIWKDLMLSQQEMTKNVDAGKNTPAAGLFEELEKTSPGYGIVPRDIADEDILQMEQMIKNMNTKDNRQLNAKGGRIGYAAGGGIMKIINKLKKLGKPKKKKLETVKDFVDRREFLKKSVGNSEKNKNKRMMDDIKRAVEEARKNPGFKFKEIDIEKEIQPILNKGRKLHATGGIASMLGE